MKESSVYQQIVKEATEKGIQQGIQQGVQQVQQIALNMLASGFSSQQVRELTGLSAKQVTQLQKSITKKSKK